MWSNVLLAAPNDVADKLTAAAADIAAERHSHLDGGETALRVTCELSPDRVRLNVVVGSAARPAARTVRIGPTDIDRAVRGRLSPLALVACALAAPRQLRAGHLPDVRASLRPDLPAFFPGSLDPAVTDLGRAIESRMDAVLIGDRGTHKTRSAARAAEMFERDGNVCFWLDLRDHGARAETVAWQLLSVPERPRILVVVNQLQANISGGERILEFVRETRADFRLPAVVMATGRPEIISLLRGAFKSFVQVPVRSAVPDHDDQARAALHWFACLRLFEIDPHVSVVRQQIEPGVLERLRNQGRIVLGASACYLSPEEDAVRLIHQVGPGSGPPPGQVIWEYLKLVGAGEGRAPLERLDLVGFRGSVRPDAAAEGSHYLAPAWDLLFRLGQALDEQCEHDPTWDDNVGAAVFAAEALAELGHYHQWSLVARFIRNRWRYGTSHDLPEAVGDQSREMRDFDDIRRFMAIEDAVIGGNFPGPQRLDPVHPLGTTGLLAGLRSDEIDIDEFHRTWMLGVLLGFEGTALDRSTDRIEALVGSATRACAQDGSFYPRRVPWVTARVVLGLCRVGLNRDNSEVVSRACDWLVTPLRAGGPYGEWWKGGTGSWNRDEATTAMCVTALIRAGVDPGTPQVREALAWLRSRAGEWTRSDREIDLALVLEAVLLGDEDWRSAYGRILNLLHWANAEFRRVRQDRPEPRFVPEGELRAPFAAAQLATLVRVAVGRESAALLADLRAPAAASLPHQRAAPSEPVTTMHGTQAGVRPLPSVQRWRQAAEMIEAELNRLVESRAAVLRRDPFGQAVEIRAKLRHYRQQLEQCQNLAAQLSDWTPAFVLEGLKQLGDEVFGLGWDDDLSFLGDTTDREPR